MGMMAIFECVHCRTRTVRGNFKGNHEYQAEFPCYPCKARTKHVFVEYDQIDERTEAVRAKEALVGK